MLPFCPTCLPTHRTFDHAAKTAARRGKDSPTFFIFSDSPQSCFLRKPTDGNRWALTLSEGRVVVSIRHRSGSRFGLAQFERFSA